MFPRGVFRDDIGPRIDVGEGIGAVGLRDGGRLAGVVTAVEIEVKINGDAAQADFPRIPDSVGVGIVPLAAADGAPHAHARALDGKVVGILVWIVAGNLDDGLACKGDGRVELHLERGRRTNAQRQLRGLRGDREVTGVGAREAYGAGTGEGQRTAAGVLDGEGSRHQAAVDVGRAEVGVIGQFGSQIAIGNILGIAFEVDVRLVVGDVDGIAGLSDHLGEARIAGDPPVKVAPAAEREKLAVLLGGDRLDPLFAGGGIRVGVASVAVEGGVELPVGIVAQQGNVVITGRGFGPAAQHDLSVELDDDRHRQV